MCMHIISCTCGYSALRHRKLHCAITVSDLENYQHYAIVGSDPDSVYF